MKLKYKKMILMISMCTMGIGMVTFSMTNQSDKNSTGVEEKVSTMVAYDASAVAINDSEEESTTVLPTVTPMPTIAPTEEETSAKVVSVTLEDNTHKDINKLIKKYLNAKLKNDISKFETLVNDTSLLDLEDIERKTKYIEEYQNLECYTCDGAEAGSYIVYAYHEVKFTSIDTMAPAMNEFYVKTDANGDPYIYLGEIDEATEEYMNQVRNSEEVMELIYNVNDKLEKAVKNDDALAEFCLKLQESTKAVTMND
jgi:hypothetical protein